MIKKRPNLNPHILKFIFPKFIAKTFTTQRELQRIITKSPNVSEALSALDLASSQGMVINSGTYSVLVNKLVAFNENQMAKKVFHDYFVTKGTNPKSWVLGSMVVCCFNLGETDEAIEYFHALVSKERAVHGEGCNILINGLCEKDRILEAFKFFVEVNNAGILVGVYIYEKLIVGLCGKGLLKESLHVLGDMYSKRMRVRASIYKVLVHGLCKRGCASEAWLMCIKMESAGFFIGKAIYTNVINTYCNGGKMKMALLVFFKMMKMKGKPDTYTYNSLINTFFRLGMTAEGFFFHKKMLASGINPNTMTYNTIIRMCFKEGKTDCALRCLDQMRMTGVAPDVYSYTSLISGLFQVNMCVRGNQVYKEMLRDKIVPDHLLFLTIVKYVEGSDLKFVLAFLRRVAKIQCGMDCSMWQYSGDLKGEIEHLLKLISRRNPSLSSMAFGMYILVLCEMKKFREAFHYLDKMISLEIQPLLFTYNTLIKCLCQKGFVKDADSLHRHMLGQGIFPNMATYLVMVNEHCKRNDLKSALDVVDYMICSGLKPSGAIYDALNRCLCK